MRLFFHFNLRNCHVPNMNEITGIKINNDRKMYLDNVHSSLSVVLIGFQSTLEVITVRRLWKLGCDLSLRFTDWY